MNQEEIYQQQIESVNLLIYEAEESVRDLKKQKHNLLINRYKMRTGLKEGDVVTWKDWARGKGEIFKKGRILEFTISFDKVTPNVEIFLKDGTVGKLTRNYFAGVNQPTKV